MRGKDVTTIDWFHAWVGRQVREREREREGLVIAIKERFETRKYYMYRLYIYMCVKTGFKRLDLTE